MCSFTETATIALDDTIDLLHAAGFGSVKRQMLQEALQKAGAAVYHRDYQSGDIAVAAMTNAGRFIESKPEMFDEEDRARFAANRLQVMAYRNAEVRDELDDDDFDESARYSSATYS